MACRLMVDPGSRGREAPVVRVQRVAGAAERAVVAPGARVHDALAAALAVPPRRA